MILGERLNGTGLRNLHGWRDTEVLLPTAETCGFRTTSHQPEAQARQRFTFLACASRLVFVLSARKPAIVAVMKAGGNGCVALPFALGGNDDAGAHDLRIAVA